MEGETEEGGRHLKEEKEEESVKTELEEVADKAKSLNLAVENELEVVVAVVVHHGVVVVVVAAVVVGVVTVEQDIDPAANQVTPAKIANQVAPASTANQVTPVRAVNQAILARIVNRVILARTVNRVIQARTVNRVILAKIVNRVILAETANRVILANPVMATRLIQVIAVKDRLRVTIAMLVIQANILLDLIRAIAITNYQIIRVVASIQQAVNIALKIHNTQIAILILMHHLTNNQVVQVQVLIILNTLHVNQIMNHNIRRTMTQMVTLSIHMVIVMNTLIFTI